MTKMFTDFEKAGMKMEMKGDAMNDAMNMNADDAGADEIYASIMDEVGMSVNMDANAGTGQI